MSESTIGEILGAVLGGSRGGVGGAVEGGLGGALGGMMGGSTGSALGGILGGLVAGRSSASQSQSPGGGMLLAMLLPLAMGWVQKNGGVGAVLDRFRQQGLGPQAASWVSTQPNAPLQTQDVNRVVGEEDIDAMAQKLGVPREQVAHGLSQILPQVIDKVSPAGAVPHDADQRVSSGMSQLQSALQQTLSRFG